MQKNLTLQQLLQVLTDLVEEKRSGTLFIHSTCNHAVTFALDKGRIFAIFHGARRGRKAIPLISQIAGGTYRFESSELSGISHDLPPTSEILNQLKTGQTGTYDRTDKTAASALAQGGVSNESKDQLCRELKSLLSDYVGPIAEMVFDEALDEIGDFCTSAGLTQTLIDRLSLDITDPDEVTRFREQAYSLINRSLKD